MRNYPWEDSGLHNNAAFSPFHDLGLLLGRDPDTKSLRLMVVDSRQDFELRYVSLPSYIEQYPLSPPESLFKCAMAGDGSFMLAVEEESWCLPMFYVVRPQDKLS